MVAMSTVFRLHGLRVVIYPPPREHSPPHVHVFGSTGQVIIHLPVEGRAHVVRRVMGMKQAEVAKAERVVVDNAEMLLRRWGEIWRTK